MIRTTAAVSIGLAALAALTAVMGEARARQYPWCAMVAFRNSMAENCGFTSYRQCMATLSGQNGYCQRNLRYEGPAEIRSQRRAPQRYR